MHDDTPIRVLVVSGDGGLRETAATLVLKHGAYVATAAGGADAFRICTSPHPPDVVLVDGCAAEASGGSVAALLDGLCKVFGPRPRVILLAGEGTPVEWRDHPEVFEVLDPPWSVETLGGAIREAVARCSIRPPAFPPPRLVTRSA
jgi:DNA-binding NtrC family response regulator